MECLHCLSDCVTPYCSKCYCEMQKRNSEQFCIDPQGCVHKFADFLPIADILEIPSIHYEIATCCFPNHPHPDDYIWRMGWILIGSAASGNIVKKKITNRQYDVLDKYKIYKVINEKEDRVR